MTYSYNIINMDESPRDRIFRMMKEDIFEHKENIIQIEFTTRKVLTRKLPTV